MNKEKLLITLEADKLEAKTEFDLKKKIILETGYNPLVITSNSVLFQDVDVKKIIDIYPTGPNAMMTFASSSDNYVTESPFKLSISNYTHIDSMKWANATLEYESASGLDISINITNLDFKVKHKMINPRSRAKYPKTYHYFYLETDLKCQKYAFDNLVYHGTYEQFMDLL